MPLVAIVTLDSKEYNHILTLKINKFSQGGNTVKIRNLKRLIIILLYS